MARAVKLLMELSIDGYDTFNLGRGIEYSVREVVQAFSDELGEEVSIEVDPNRVRKTERMHLLADITKFKNTINWQPEWSLEQGIKT
jgi:UDP-glucose 4-epimerase